MFTYFFRDSFSLEYWIKTSNNFDSVITLFKFTYPDPSM